MGVSGSVEYMAPEAIDGEFSSASDLWSCGVIAFAMMSGYLPFRGESDEVEVEVCRGAFFFNPLDWEQISDDAKDLIRRLLKRRPSQRCTAANALQDKWFEMLTSGDFVSELNEKTLKALEGMGAKVEADF